MFRNTLLFNNNKTSLMYIWLFLKTFCSVLIPYSPLAGDFLGRIPDQSTLRSISSDCLDKMNSMDTLSVADQIIIARVVEVAKR